MVHPKLLKWKNVDLTKIQNLAAVDQDIADAERDLEILKQGLIPQATPTIRQHIRGQKKARQPQTGDSGLHCDFYLFL